MAFCNIYLPQMMTTTFVRPQVEQVTITQFNTGFQSGVYAPPICCTVRQGSLIPMEQHCRKVNVTISPSLMKFVIGKQGYYFNAITKASGTNYIWYKKEENVIEVWGPPQNLWDAEKRLKERMNDIEWKWVCSETNIKPNEKWGDMV